MVHRAPAATPLCVVALLLSPWLAPVAADPPRRDARAPFALPGGALPAVETEAHTSEPAVPGITARRVRFPSAVRTAVERNNTVHGILFTPARPTKRAVVLLPWFKEGSTQKIEMVGQAIAAGGFKVLFLAMGYQHQRAPEGYGSGDYILKGPDMEHVRQWMRQAVLDARRGRRWLVETQGVEKVGVMGISLGGFVSAVTYGVAPEFDGAAVLLAGGNLARYIKLGAQAKIPQITKGLQRLRISADELPKALAPIDPITHADPERKDGLLMINGLLDPVIPFPLASDLWKAWGKPKMVRLPAGHVTSIAFVPLIISKVAVHFDRVLGPPR